MYRDHSKGSDVFKAQSRLAPNHHPTEVLNREQELEVIESALEPLTRRNPAENLLIHGPAGVGKSTCLQHVLESLGERSSVTTITINCWQYNTRSSLLSQLLIELGYPAPRKGKPIDELLSKVQEWLERHDGVTIVLEEFDQLQDQTEIAYDLHHCSRSAGSPIGLILVSNKSPGEMDLDARSESRLRYREVAFDAYDADALHEILFRRAEEAFEAGAFTEDAVRCIAEYVAQEGGDCRYGLELLHRAGRIANRANNGKMTAVHSEQSVETSSSRSLDD